MVWCFCWVSFPWYRAPLVSCSPFLRFHAPFAARIVDVVAARIVDVVVAARIVDVVVAALVDDAVVLLNAGLRHSSTKNDKWISSPSQFSSLFTVYGSCLSVVL